MRTLLSSRFIYETAALGLSLVFLCEVLIYYLVIFSCSYPQLESVGNDENALRAMFVADTHLLGSRLGHWFDKLRREWQMHRAFWTAYTLFKPELVVFLGDIFDEGKWCSPDEFDYYVERFRDLFSVDADVTKVHVVAGNHDIGFHYAVTPYLNFRFSKAFQVGPVERFSVKGVQFVSVNSMALEGDGCFLCSEGEAALHQTAKELACLRDWKSCDVKYDHGMNYSPPVLLQHFPLYRESDADCNEEDAAPQSEKVKAFRENFDCVSRNSSRALLDSLQPRLVLSGHTHHGCRVEHELDRGGRVPEWSVSSFSWRNRNNPTFLLGTFTLSDYALEKCFVPRENVVINIYIAGAVLLALLILKRGCF
jgi:hypothetical protein